MRHPSTESPSSGRLRAWTGATVLAVALAGAARADLGGPFAVHVVTLEHQSAAEAVTLVHPQLSPEGTVEQRGEDGLVVRDRRSRIEAIRRLLAAFDHPARMLRLEIQVVEASTGSGPTPAGRPLPEELSRRLRELLRYERFTVLGDARLEVREREEVSYRVGGDYRIAFRLGAMLDGSLRLHGFQVTRIVDNPGQRQLLHTDLALTADRPMVLGLAPSESSDRALMVVLEVAGGGEED